MTHKIKNKLYVLISILTAFITLTSLNSRAELLDDLSAQLSAAKRSLKELGHIRLEFNGAYPRTELMRGEQAVSYIENLKFLVQEQERNLNTELESKTKEERLSLLSTQNDKNLRKFFEVTTFKMMNVAFYRTDYSSVLHMLEQIDKFLILPSEKYNLSYYDYIQLIEYISEKTLEMFQRVLKSYEITSDAERQKLYPTMLAIAEKYSVIKNHATNLRIELQNLGKRPEHAQSTLVRIKEIREELSTQISGLNSANKTMYCRKILSSK